MTDLKNLVKITAGVQSELSGGNGHGYDEAILIRNNGVESYMSVQRAILWSLGCHKNMCWEVIDQEAHAHNGRTIDVLTIEKRKMDDQGIVSTGTQQVFFDISEFESEVS
ncbi:MAG: hypothetical protein MJK10_00330 [Pseudomonadales bacterium]|nr:hypothetical protein [Pseudomonadales bacterium]NRA14324.1 hypothetical protein [Oceanospirillaceae bacterium]